MAAVPPSEELFVLLGISFRARSRGLGFGYIGVIYRDNGKPNGSYYIGYNRVHIRVV